MTKSTTKIRRKVSKYPDSSGEFIFITDSDLNVKYVNEKVKKGLKFQSEDSTDKKIFDIIPDLNQPKLVSQVSDIISNKKSLVQNFTWEKKDRKKKSYQVSVKALKNDVKQELLWKINENSQKEILEKKLRWQNVRLKFLENISKLLSTQRDLQSILTNFAEELEPIVSFKSLSILLPYSLEKFQFSLLYLNHNGKHIFPNNEIIDLTGNDIFNDVIQLKEFKIQSRSSQNSKQILTSAEIKYTENLAHIIHIPVIFEDEILGILNVGQDKTYHFHKEDIDFLVQITGYLAIALKNSFYFNLVRLQNKKLFIINSIFNAPQNSNNILQICQNTLSGLFDLMKCEIGSFYRSTDGQIWQKIILQQFQNNLPKQLKLPPVILEEKTRFWDKINPSIVDLEVTKFEDLSQTGLFSWLSSSSFGYLAFLSLNNQILDQINRNFISTLIEDIMKQMIIALDQISLFEKIKRAEKEWETTFNTVNIGLVVVDDNFQIIRTNEAFLKLFDFNQSNVIGQTCDDTFCRNKNNCLCHPQSKLNWNTKQQEDEYFDKEIKRWIYRIFYPIYSSKHVFKGGVFSIHDVTEQRKQEIKIKFLSKFPETSPNFVISMDSNANINYLNPAAKTLVKELNLKENDYYLILPDNLKILLKNFNNKNINHMELEHRYKERLLQYVLHKPKDDEHFYLYGTDITEKADLQKQLLQTERIKAVGEMAAGVAHDFNNLLATILGRTQLLLLKSEHEERKNELKIIEKAAIDGGKIVRRLQEVTREKREKTFSAIDINDSIKESILFTASKLKISTQLKGQKVQLHTHFKDKCIVKGDEVELKEVFTNLLLNAYDAMPKGGELFITTQILDNNKVKVIIKDTGIGMSEEVKNKIFNPFFTTKGEKGTGMGLSIVYKTITVHKGYIGVRSKKNKGTAFTIILPLSEEPVKKHTTQINHIQEKYSETRLLIVDDEPELLDTMAEILRLKFKSVDIAPGGKEALLKVHKTKYDIVLSDLGMPEMSGWELAQKIKSKNPKAKIILVTGWGEQAKEEHKHHPDVDAILPKPYSFDELILIINSFFRNNQ